MRFAAWKNDLASGLFPGLNAAPGVLIRGRGVGSDPTERKVLRPVGQRNESREQAIVRSVRPLIDLEDHCPQIVASSVASREIPHVAVVAFQESLPEGNGMQLDLGNQNFVRDYL